MKSAPVPVGISSTDSIVYICIPQTEEDALELDEFYLQYCHGIAQGNDDDAVLFRDAYKVTCQECVLCPEVGRCIIRI